MRRPGPAPCPGSAVSGPARILAGKPLRYGKPGFDNPAFVAGGPE